MNIYLLIGLGVLGYYFLGFLFFVLIDFKDFDRKSSRKAYMIFLLFGIVGFHNLYLNFYLKYIFNSLIMIVLFIVVFLFVRENGFSIEEFFSNDINKYALIITTILLLLDLIMMPYWVFKSNYSERIYREPDVELELRKCQEDLENSNYRLTKLFKTDGFL